MLDRFKEFKAMVKNNERGAGRLALDEDDIEIALNEEIPSESEFISPLYKEVTKYIDGLKKAQQESKDLGVSYMESLTKVLPPPEQRSRMEKFKSLRNDIQKYINSGSKAIESFKSSCDKLEKVQQENDKKRANNEIVDAEDVSVQVRIRKNQYLILGQVLENTIVQFGKVQSDYDTANAENISRNLRAVYPDITEDQINQKINDRDFDHTQLISSVILHRSSASHTANAALERTKELYEDLKKIDEVVTDILEMARDINGLLREQQATIDNIERNVTRANNYVERATKDLKTANKVAKTNRKMIFMIICGVIVLVVILIVILVVALGVGIPLARLGSG